MIPRLTIIAIVAATVGLNGNLVMAQTGRSAAVSSTRAIDAAYSDSQGRTDKAGCADPVDCDDRACDTCTPSGHRLYDPNCNCPYCRPRTGWGTFEGLLWWGKGRSLPPLLTTGPAIPQSDAGVLGRPGTQILFGNGGVGTRAAGGARADFGMWLDNAENLGVGAKVWGIDGDMRGTFASSPTGDPVLARPFYNVVLDQQDAFLAAYPGLITGNMTIETDSSVISAEAYLRTSMFHGRGYNLDLIGGYHFIRFDDRLLIVGNSVSVDPGGSNPVGTTIDITDSFDAHNEFHGGNLGIVGEIRHGRWTLNGLAKLSVGNMRETVTINGVTTVTTPNPGGTTTTNPGGLLALPTNMGSYSRSTLALIPEVNMTLSYELRRWLHLSVGYNAVYWSDVMMSGDQIDMNVNPTQMNGGILLGPPSPVFPMRHTEYWMHGISLGATFLF